MLDGVPGRIPIEKQRKKMQRNFIFRGGAFYFYFRHGQLKNQNQKTKKQKNKKQKTKNKKTKKKTKKQKNKKKMCVFVWLLVSWVIVHAHVPYYYINVNTSTTRRAKMEQRFAKFNLTRIEAVTPQTMPNVLWPPNCRQNDYEKCCSLSHLKAIYIIYHHHPDQEYALILEDDSVLIREPDWDHFFDILKRHEISSWHIIQLFTFSTSIYTEPNPLRFIPVHSKWHASTLAYLIHREGMEYILNRYNLLRHYPWETFQSSRSRSRSHPRSRSSFSSSYHLDLSSQKTWGCTPESFVYSLPG